MFTFSNTTRYAARLTAGLVVTLLIVVGSLTQALSNIQTFI